MKLRFFLPLACLACLFLLELGECQKKEEKVTETVGKAAREKQTPGKKLKPSVKKIKARKEKKTMAKESPPVFIMSLAIKKGVFQKPPETLSVPAGGRFELRCRGKPINWRYPSYLDEDADSRFRISHREKFSQLILTNTTGADTGEYGCWALHCDGQNCRKDESKTGSTYVFFTDPRELFIPSNDYYEAVQLRTDRPTRLPCRVTNPMAKVTLHREFPPEEIPLDGTLITFDVTKGFVVHKAVPSFAGTVYCVASYQGLRQSSTKYLLIFVRYPSARPSAVIKASVSSARVGENFNLTCAALGEPEIPVDFTWVFPGQKLGRPTYTRETQRQVYIGRKIQQLSQSVLLVDESRPVDEGLYSCTAQNMQGQSTASTTVKVLPHPSPGQT
uniref:Platelet-derived growth factor receptor-like protein n=1 Tax=Callorhinchus milii TaxID=7868 RepID=A0A4W3GCM9_CALMI|eukprot:gi/632967803/ref/XP_007900182.1/ PREDICTED: platelet-derived growth factor receptor-like protein [Callorhinchus milii]